MLRTSSTPVKIYDAGPKSRWLENLHTWLFVCLFLLFYFWFWLLNFFWHFYYFSDFFSGMTHRRGTIISPDNTHSPGECRHLIKHFVIQITPMHPLYGHVPPQVFLDRIGQKGRMVFFLLFFCYFIWTSESIFKCSKRQNVPLIVDIFDIFRPWEHLWSYQSARVLAVL